MMYGDNSASKVYRDHMEEIPCGDNADYVDGTYKISADELDNNDVDKITENLRFDWYVEERDATKYDVVDSKIGGAA